MSKRAGNVAELRVAAKLIEKGFVVSKPFGDNAKYDLIVDNEGHLQRLQIKSGRIVKNSIVFSACSSYRNVRHRYTAKDIDGFAIYVPILEKIYIYPFDRERDECWLSLENIPRNKLTRLAKDYEV